MMELCTCAMEKVLGIARCQDLYRYPQIGMLPALDSERQKILVLSRYVP